MTSTLQTARVFPRDRGHAQGLGRTLYIYIYIYMYICIYIYIYIYESDINGIKIIWTIKNNNYCRVNFILNNYEYDVRKCSSIND